MQLNEWDVIVLNRQFTTKTVEFGVWEAHKNSFLLHVFSILLVILDGLKW